LAQLLPARAFLITKFTRRMSSQSGDERTAPITPGSKLKRTERGKYLLPNVPW
jgi:hypothetical protein